MQSYSEAEIQALIALAELAEPVETPNNIEYSFYPQTLEQAATYFRRFREDWTGAYASLEARGLLYWDGQNPALTPAGLEAARQLRLERPPIYYWYRDFYTQIANSPTNAIFSERVFGKNLGQQGFMDMEQLDKLVQETGIGPSSRVLDLGCGNGLVLDYIVDTTGAYAAGIDYIPEAIEQARRRTADRRDQLDFRLGNLDHLDVVGYPAASFDTLLAVDTLYMPNDLPATLRQMRDLLAPGGRIGIYYSFDLWADPNALPSWLLPEGNPLGQALTELEMRFTTWDYTQADYRHARLKKQVAAELKEAFEAEGNAFLYEIRAAEADGVIKAVESGVHARYLYLVTV